MVCVRGRTPALPGAFPLAIEAARTHPADRSGRERVQVVEGGYRIE